MNMQATNEGSELLGVEKIENAKWNGCKAVLMLLLGSLIAASLADPLVNCAGSFSTGTKIPPFLVSLVVVPFTSSSELLSALMFASRNMFRVASFTFSKVSFFTSESFSRVSNTYINLYELLAACRYMEHWAQTTSFACQPSLSCFIFASQHGTSHPSC